MGSPDAGGRDFAQGDVLMLVIPWILAFWTVATMWLAGNRAPVAWWSGIASQGLWLYFDWRVEAWGLMPLAVVLTAVYVRNLRKWRE